MRARDLLVPVLGLFLVAGTVSAQDKPEAAGDKRPHRMWGKLGLNDDQEAKLKDLHKEMRTTQSEHFEKVKAVREKVRQELLKQNPSESVLKGYARELGDLHGQLSEKRGAHLLQVKKILTPEQFEKIVNKEWQGGKGGPMKGCPQGKGGPGRHGGRGGCPMGRGPGGTAE